MRPRDSEILRRVIEWFEYGDEDLRLARHGLTLTSGVPYRQREARRPREKLDEKKLL